MIKKIIAVFVILLTSAAIYAGVMNDMEQIAEAEEKVVYAVHVMKNTDSGYVPMYDFEMSKPSLEAHVKLCWFSAHRCYNGDLLIGFDEGEKTWFVHLEERDPEIKRLQEIAKDFGLKCSIP